MAKLAQIKNINGMKVLAFEASCFIIPNAANPATGWCSESTQQDRIKFGNDVLAANGVDGEIDPDNDRFLQLWFHNDVSENIRDHGMRILSEDGQDDYIQPAIEYIPAKLFEGRKEGDTLMINIPVSRYNRAKDEREFVMLVIHLHLDQLNYRYRQFGPFEELMDKLLNA